ncbi:YkvA family protein [Sediminibacillus halophilus]|uniref:Uncharacterized membrane protein YkvA, DUF1232 family n=1 Tax=Sediminibacillus halophilus TaxID=482461 RepID=A0A1G9WUX1_9BACI|nr:DUF1232 domain-containing protein [Sediminibacillus halophilus]SDM87903.1 Uncharacterized membrane protein YkvA, DUF1232 family [Sediminibacillus halophilus]
MLRFVRRLKFLVNFRKSLPFLKDFFLSKQVSLATKTISIVLIIGYILFPFDIIPDFLLVFGIFDDVAVAGFILQQMVKMAPETLKEKHGLNKI